MWLLAPDTTSTLRIDDDDGPGYGSYIQYQTSRGGYPLKIVVAGFSAERQGTCDVTLKANGTPIHFWDNQTFGGWNKKSHRVEAGDHVFVGVPPDGADHTLFSNRLFVFDNHLPNCDSNCGFYVEGTTLSGLSFADIPFADYTWIQVGSALPDTAVSTRLFHSRLGSGWGSYPQYQDNDGDGLTWQLEELSGQSDPSLGVDTCDTTTGPSVDCSTSVGLRFGARAGFAPPDTDNDGLLDHWEIFGVTKLWSQIPEAPFFDPGTYIGDGTWTGCGATYCVSTALSALDTSPREFDALVHVDTVGDLTHDHYLDASQQSFVTYMFEQEGLECASNVSTDSDDCPGELDHHNRVMIRLAPGSVLHEDQNVGGGVRVTAAPFNNHMPAYRKHTGTHRYAWLLHMGGGSSTWAPGRRFAIHEKNGLRYANDFAHELGHLLGLWHGGFESKDGCETRNDKVNYPSIMNYAYDYTMACKNRLEGGGAWPADYGKACASSGDCPESGYCFPGTSTCSIEVGDPCMRFSRGLLDDLDEAALPEDPIVELLAAAQPGYDPKGDGVGLNPYSACCDTPYFDCPATSVCGIDWDGDADKEAAPVCANLNWFNNEVDDPGCDPAEFDDDPDCTAQNPVGDVFQDNDDWTRMYDIGACGWDDNFYTEVRPYGSNFDDDGSGLAIDGTDYAGYDQAVTVSGVASTASVNPSYQEAGLFSGPGSGDVVTVSASPSVQSMGMEMSGHGSLGWRADAFIRVDDFTSGAGHQLFDSNLFQVDIVNDQGGVFGTLRVWFNSGSGWSIGSSSRVIQQGAWYYVVAGYDGDPDPENWQAGKLRIYVVSWDAQAGDWAYVNGECDEYCIPKTADVAPGSIKIGKYGSGTSWALKGALDEPILYNYWTNVRDIKYVAGCPNIVCP